ncbi:vanadium-dependent haloperoxidase [Actinoplanes philippinensis]|uniref:vanadium-dependent haloperoxidase n=1 Tax=Actinoplanes philippinensis TaxID=35752 RepID=UPI0033FB764A
MRRILVVILSALLGAGLASPAAQATASEPDLHVVAGWNALALDAVRSTRASDADAARLYALVNVAIYDAVNGISGTHSPALITERGPRHANPQAAAAAAAHAVLVRADATRAPLYDTRLAADLAALRRSTESAPRQRDTDSTVPRLGAAGAGPGRGVDSAGPGRGVDNAGPGRGVDSGATWGARIGAAVVDARADDGSTPVEQQPAGSGPGVFRAAWSGVQYRNVRPFAIADPARYVPPPPPALDSAAYATAYAEVAELGDATVDRPDLLATYQFWSLPAGSSQPPGEWLRIALAVAEARHLRLADEARLGALLTMALADTTVVTVATKFTYRHWRPTTAIRETTDPAWTARAGSVGSSPEYVSGHSSYSGAAATVLAGFFHSDRIAFTHATDSAPGGVARSYPGFQAAAAEAGRSRVYGGLHFDFSNRTGLSAGSAVAREVLARCTVPYRT